MAASLLQNSRLVIQRAANLENVNILQHIRTTYTIRHRGKPPELTKSWKQRVDEITQPDPVLDAKVNIGFPTKKAGRTKITRKELRQMKDEGTFVELEKKARTRELIVPLDELREADFEAYSQHHIHRVADHYGVYRDLFGDAYFYPQIMLNVAYDVQGDEELVNPVYYGNVLPPAETQCQPDVHYSADPDRLYTLCMTAPDSHLQDNQQEYLHWMVGNISGSSVCDGDQLCDYLQPFPLRGTGQHRYVFILYQQERRIDFTDEQRPPNCTSLSKRSFKSLEFYRQHQDDMTPVGVTFFQSEWDETVRHTFHQVLDMAEPEFEFLPPLPYIPQQKIWPIREPFNVYMDRYRDVKDINEEVLVEKLKTVDPFKPRTPAKKYPLVYHMDPPPPSWLRMKINEKKLRQSYWKGLDD